jgi:hypothetical protein
MLKTSVLGLAAWTIRIAEFGPIRKARLQRGFEKHGAELVERIKVATPVRKGALRDSVRMRKAKTYPGVTIIAGGTPETARGPNLDEALLTEYGTRRERAEPFFWPTIQADAGAVRRALSGDVTSDESD